ncbi:MAG TPA: redoxin domain-containing protein [Gemmatimonadaceae bacterium]|nr:redoxin domain-containing protein [Gemmatimonadaceae bacterium]
MEAYRDQYARLFNNGKNVVVLAVSVDADTTLADWARESSFPFAFGSDSGQVVGKLFGSTRGRLDSRNLFVIAPDGRISYRVIGFNVLSQDAYAALGSAVARAMGSPANGATSGGAP